MSTDIRQLTKAGTQFYPQTHIAALVGYGSNGEAIDDKPATDSDNLVASGGVEQYTKNSRSVASSLLNVLPLKQGTLNLQTGEYYITSNRVITSDYLPSPFYIKVNSAYNIPIVFKFVLNKDGSLEYVSSQGYTNTKILFVDKDEYVYMVSFSANNEDLSPTDDIISELHTNLKCEENISDYQLKKYNSTNGRYWNLSSETVDDSPVEHTGGDLFRCCDEIPVKSGDIFILTTKGGSNARAYAVSDSERNIVEVSDSNVYVVNQTINVQQDGFLFVNCQTGYYGAFSVKKYYSIESLQTIISELDNKIKVELNGNSSSLLATSTYADSVLDVNGNVISAVGYEVKEYAVKADCSYRVISRIASSGNKYERTFIYKFYDNNKIGYVPLASQAYDVNCDVTFPCDGSFNKILVMGLTGVQSVEEQTHTIFDKTDYDTNGFPLPKTAQDGRLPIMQSASCVGMIRKWGFIGASYESGGFEYKDNGVTKYMQDYDVSFPQILMRLNGTDGYCFSGSGQSAKQWCTQTGHYLDPSSGIEWDWYDRGWNGGNSRVAEELKQAYVIELGSNDMSQGQTIGNISTDVDLTDYNNNADTYAGWICGVIQRVLSVNPKAFFFVCTLRRYYNGERRMKASEVVRQIPDFFKDNGITDRIYLLDIEKYGMDWAAPANAAYYNGTHPTALGYYYLACWFNTYIDDIIKRNMLDFNEIQFVGTDKHYN